jgi:hypothetical protein
MNRKTFRSILGLLVLGAALVVVVWRPWQPQAGPAATEPDPPAEAVSVTILKRSGGPCGVEIRGTGGGASNVASASLGAGEARSIPLRFPAPYTIEAVTVTRNGSVQRRDMKVTLAGGRRYELLINADDTVAVVPAPSLQQTN